MAKAFFVSDVHIKKTNDDRYRKFMAFLDYVLKNKASHLFILGDLFEFLYGNPNYIIKKYSLLFNKLEKLGSSGVKIYYLYGNHDFSFDLMFPFIKVEKEIPRIIFEGKNLGLFHGDGLDPSDKKYIFLKGVLRSKIFRIFASLLPSSILYALAGFFSNLSRNINLSKNSRKFAGWKPYRDKAISLLESTDLDVLIYAHTHVAELTLLRNTSSKIRQKIYINAGFFGENGSYCMMDNDLVYVGIFKD
jgi:UDP-2,3-diacylglucosamine hydrolase